LIDSITDRPQWIWPGQVNRVVVERGSLRTTVVWNASPQPVRAEVQAAARSALAVTQYGETGEVVARNGTYTLDLAPTAHNADPRDRSIYLIGGRPWILEEVVAPLPDRVRTRIQSVWPHNNAPVDQANLANVTVQLLAENGQAPVPCRWEPRVVLRARVDNGPEQILGIGTKSMERQDDLTYPVWRFDNVPVSPARQARTMTFSVNVEDIPVIPEYYEYAIPSPPPIPPKPEDPPTPTLPPTNPPPTASCQ
jgi:hypothetical protein